MFSNLLSVAVWIIAVGVVLVVLNITRAISLAINPDVEIDQGRIRFDWIMAAGTIAVGIVCLIIAILFEGGY